MCPKGTGTAQCRKCRFILGEITEQGTSEFNVTAAPGSQPTGPASHHGLVTAYTQRVAGLANSFAINTKDEIGMRNFAAQLAFLPAGEIAAVAVVINQLQGTAWPAAADGAAYLTRDRTCLARRCAACRRYRDGRPIAVSCRQAKAVQISGFGGCWPCRVLWLALFGKPVNATRIRMVIIAFQPGRQFTVT